MLIPFNLPTDYARSREAMLSSKYTSVVARLSFLGLAAISAFLLTAHYKLALPDDHPYGAQRVLGSQAVSSRFTDLLESSS